jgi:hypothetical protein
LSVVSLELTTDNKKGMEGVLRSMKYTVYRNKSETTAC